MWKFQVVGSAGPQDLAPSSLGTTPGTDHSTLYFMPTIPFLSLFVYYLSSYSKETTSLLRFQRNGQLEASSTELQDAVNV